jgi:hypothetical protein
MYVIAILMGIAAGFATWFVVSFAIANSLTWAEDRYPQLVGSRRLRMGETVACSALFLGCVAVAVWVARAIILN